MECGNRIDLKSRVCAISRVAIYIRSSTQLNHSINPTLEGEKINKILDGFPCELCAFGPLFRALSGRLKLAVRRHKFNKDCSPAGRIVPLRGHQVYLYTEINVESD